MQRKHRPVETTNSLDMGHMLTVLVLLWSSGLQAEENDSSEPGNTNLTGGATRCDGGLEMKFLNVWKPVDDPSFGWNLRAAAAVCRRLDCGTVVSAKIKTIYSGRPVWKVNSASVQSGADLGDYAAMMSSSSLEITCSESVRLVNGTTLCSGRVEVKANQSWSSVCKDDFDWQDAMVVCRELGCGALLKLQWEPYENINTLEGTKEFQCRGNEPTLMDCESSESARSTCSPIALTCSEPDNIRLVEGNSRCAGRLEMKLQDDWKPVDGLMEELQAAALVCRQLKCGFAISAKIKPSAAKAVWGIRSRVQSGSALREHVSTRPWHSSSSLEITCSDLLFQPNISISPSIDGVHEYSTFTISCSIKPQYPGGSFQLIFTSSNTAHNYTQKAVDHTADFLFGAADRGHQGNYSCVYHIYVFSHNFISGSQPLFLSVSASPRVFSIRLCGLLLTLASFLSAICFHKKANRGQENIELDCYNNDDPRAQGPNEEAGAQEEV